ncbi:conserved hypothetical protein; putative signal peptide [Chloroherpeton thalassium ATCC 35110]|uniref:Tll0287-like domain-containing protein n=1 Tax=Chloroherpeton thalassium (strain ATCC 35110 / GB-78) TaxID=517418 RepID=B3QXP4_CHLT3|nr:DUF3365 domain-containing protein [Chloroherpeton thalassium]ACF14959.1 conserved hypothetical protein; putative signal peptide [Chloroherpeton thalassium ATCC 35110]
MKKKLLILFFAVVSVSACSTKEKSEAPHEKTAQVVQLAEADKQEYLAKGKEMVSITMKTLGGNLMKAMKENGVAHAAEFCNLKASPLVDSLQNVYHASIRRATLKPRNQENLATAQEEEIINAYMEQMKSENAELKPIVKMSGSDTVSFYAPIKIPAAMCLKCHGAVGTEVSEEDYKKVKELYPNDKAVGYKEGELRGIWSIHFPVAKEKM